MSPGKTPVHLDLRVDDPDAEVSAARRTLGASVRWSVGRGVGPRWTTMSDPFGVHVLRVSPAMSRQSSQ